MMDHLPPLRPIGGDIASTTAGFDAALRRLEQAAPAEDRDQADIAGSVDVLRQAGLLSDDGSADPALTARRLMRVAGANLSVARLWEGHVNARQLVTLYADDGLRNRVERFVAQGGFLGVWGADGEVPVTLDKDGRTLRGGKIFASGLGAVSHAVVTVDSGPEVRLALVDVTDPSRADAGRWQMSGMRATRSGSYDMNGIEPVGWIGGAADYVIEPYFHGGVWRIAALQLGGAIGLVEAAATTLRDRGRLDAEAQKLRLTDILIRAAAAAPLIAKAARQATAACDQPDRAVALSLSARLLTEAIGLDAIRAVEQGVGMGHFADGSITGRKARDLAVYMRQAARDAFMMRVADHALQSSESIWGLLE
ncbi:acyl-CoA dehydrogenase [Paracoccus sp. TK19116]|uniref:Acyl-CoA dehydrogenase n=1 Tax=Paracoccus albicereus TaxID=2922394 RepID=A0ABT1MPG2_9RHOB|nr:acyl-CoA dehydrogenase [Paracoccus albicereus]MCQ0969589.1 acyl-CoA dehydrogenase [Paracoccus albicereus]